MENIERLTQLREIIKKLQLIDIHTKPDNLTKIRDEIYLFFDDLFGYTFKDDDFAIVRSRNSIELIYEYKVMRNFTRSVISKSDILVVMMELFKIAFKGKCRLYVGDLEAIPFYKFINEADFSSFIQKGREKDLYYSGEYDLLEKIGLKTLSEYIDDAILKEISKRKDTIARNRALLDSSIKPSLKNLILNVDKLEYIMYSIVAYINENKNRYLKNISTSIGKSIGNFSF